MLIFEAAVAFKSRRTTEGFLELALAAAVFGEVAFHGSASKDSGELQRRSEASVAEANRKAEEANLALAKFREPRVLTPGQVEQIAEQIASFKRTPFDLDVSSNDPEIRALASFIEMALQKAGWTGLNWTGMRDVISRRGRQPTIGVGASVTNVVVGWDMRQSAQLLDPARALVDALEMVGIGVAWSAETFMQGMSTNTSAIHVQVGRKE